MASVSRQKSSRPQGGSADDAAKSDASVRRAARSEDAAQSENASRSENKAPAGDSAPARKAAPAKAAAASAKAARPADARPTVSDAVPPAPGRRLPRALFRWYLLVMIAALGVVVGVLGSFGHRASATWLGVNWPTGLILCFGGLIGLLLGLSELLAAPADRLWPTRLSAIGCASAGWLLALIWLTYLGPPTTFQSKGDVILPNDWKSITYLVGGMAVIVVAAYRAWLASLNERLAQHRGGSAGGHPRG